MSNYDRYSEAVEAPKEWYGGFLSHFVLLTHIFKYLILKHLIFVGLISVYIEYKHLHILTMTYYDRVCVR